MGRDGFFTAEQIASSFGLAVVTVHEYAAKGLLRPSHSNGDLYFHAGDFMRMEIIQKGLELGFSLSELKILLDSEALWLGTAIGVLLTVRDGFHEFDDQIALGSLANATEDGQQIETFLSQEDKIFFVGRRAIEGVIGQAILPVLASGSTWKLSADRAPWLACRCLGKRREKELFPKRIT